MSEKLTTDEMLSKAMSLLERCHEVYRPDPDAEYGFCVSCGKPTWEHAVDCEYMALRRSFETKG